MKTSISIAIPIYNAEKTLERCIGSVIASIEQAEECYRDCFSGKIICVNDGSTDTSEDIIRGRCTFQFIVYAIFKRTFD